MATNFRVKMGEIGRLTLFVASAFRNGLECHSFDFMRFDGDDLPTSFANLMRTHAGPITREFTRVVAYTPRFPK